MSGLISGQKLGHYQILEEIGEGGMATVYKARDTHLDREVAIKIIRREVFSPNQLETLLKRFEREAKSLAGLLHPNIVSVIDYGKHDDLPYLVMEYLPGGTLKELLGNPMPWRYSVRLLIPIARALEYIHDHHIINRDVKPSNILLTEMGQPMLTDFGLVKMFEGENTTSTNLTSSNVSLGTPDYMAPEQWKGNPTALSDLYSLGAVLYEMITGHTPYISDTPVGILLKQANEPLPLPKEYVPDLPQNVESVLLKALARKPESRYPDMRSFADELQNLLDGRDITAATIEIKELREQMTGEAKTPQTDQPQPAPDSTAQDEKISSPPDPLPVRKKRKFSVLSVALGMLALFIIYESSWFIGSKLGLLFGPTSTPQATILPTETDIPTLEMTPTILKSTETPVPETPVPVEPSAPVATSMPAEIKDSKNISMRLVPAGEFTMGNKDERDTESHPVSKIFVDTFYIDKYEVTNEMYGACVAVGGCKYPEDLGSATRASYFSKPDFVNYPVIYLNWKMAKTYCEWRGARLPTEAEWEKAARGTEDERAYPWGDEFNCKLANHSGCVGDTARVNQYSEGQSPYGVYGMSGNVWEWTSSLPLFYPYSPTDGREDPDASGYRIARGGSWNIFGGTGGNIRIDTRFKLDPAYYGAYVGVRCALTK